MLKIKIKRNDEFQEYSYDGDLNITVTTLLNRINENTENPIKFSSSCLQGLCGSCAMIINSLPALACQTFVCDEKMTKEYNLITIEPLSKFPLIKDLKIDRSVLHEAMKKSNQWIEGKAKINENNSFEYQMALCLLCGCCVEACPNYNCEDFPGTPIAVSSAKLTSQETNKTHLKEIKKDYEKKFYPKCVKALVCEDICPMEIETQRAISKMNKSIWKIRDLFHIR